MQRNVFLLVCGEVPNSRLTSQEALQRGLKRNGVGRAWQLLVSNPAGEGTGFHSGGKLRGSFGKSTKELPHKEKGSQGNKRPLSDRINLSRLS